MGVKLTDEAINLLKEIKDQVPPDEFQVVFDSVGLLDYFFDQLINQCNLIYNTANNPSNSKEKVTNLINGFNIYVSHYATALDEAEYVLNHIAERCEKHLLTL